MANLHPHQMTRARSLGMLLAVVLGLLLTGCAGVIRLEHDVHSYPRWASTAQPAAGDRFQIERLPSQDQRTTPEQRALEAAVASRLEAAGLRRVERPDTPAQWQVEVSARSQKFPHAPWDHPADRWPGPGLAGRDYVVNGRGQVIALPVFPWPAPPYYQRELSVVVRDAQRGRVVYESRAAHDGPWHGTPALWDALATAVLDGFPRPPTGPRRVVIDVPR